MGCGDPISVCIICVVVHQQVFAFFEKDLSPGRENCGVNDDFTIPSEMGMSARFINSFGL